MDNSKHEVGHTPEPWVAKKAQIGSTWVVYGPDEFPVASTPSNSTLEGMKRVQLGVMQSNAEFIACACNAHDALLEYFNASTAFSNTVGHEDATVEDERKAEERFDKAGEAVLAVLAAAKA